MRIVKSLVPALLLASLFSNLSYAVSPDRIGSIDSSRAVPLTKSVHPKALIDFDRGAVAPSFKLQYMTLVTAPSAAQQRALNQVMAAQQDPTSPSYHQWLTPAQYADRFGLSQNDMDRVTGWLKSQGFTVLSIGGGRNTVVFSGTAAQVQKAFNSEIHHFSVEGEEHFANATSLMIPAALSGIVTGVRGVNDFRMHTSSRMRSNFGAGSGPSSKPSSGPKTRANYFDGNFIFPNFLAPADVETIYDTKPLITAASPNDGTGEKIAIVGRTDIFLADINDFRSAFGLTPISASNCTLNTATATTANVITACNDPRFKYILLPGQTEPLVPDSAVQGDITEADLDVEWSGAAAPGAQVIYVNAPQSDVTDSLAYAINPPTGTAIPAPIISMSFGTCEPGVNTFMESELQQGAAEGITLINSTGDQGAAACDGSPTETSRPFATGAVNGLAVNYPASSQYVTGVGGTSISLANDSYPNPNATFWNAANGATGGSAVKYIPELTWNDEEAFAAYCAAPISGDTFCAQSTAGWVKITSAQTAQEDIWINSGGGGASNCFTSNTTTCTGGFPQPSWQSTLTVPSAPTTRTRWVPDVSLLASANFPGYILCTPQDPDAQSNPTPVYTSTCVNGISGATGAVEGFNSLIGGTSASAPIFAGFVALLNQYLAGPASPGLGLINPTLYTLAKTRATNKAFNQTTGGDNNAYCSPHTPSFQTSTFQCPTAGVMGYNAANQDTLTGYNLVTGLGSVDVNNLAIAWAGSRSATTVSTLITSSPQVNLGQSVTLTATLSSTTALGNVNFFVNGSATPVGTVALATADAGVAALQTTSLPAGTDHVTAAYAGDGLHKPSAVSSSVTVTVTAPDFSMAANPTTTSVIAGHNSAGITLTFTPINGMNQPITPSCTGMPTGATCAFSKTPVPMDGTNAQTTVMTITTAANMAAATTGITISATGSGVTHTITPFNLTTTATDQTFTLTDVTTSFSVKQGSSVNTTITVTPGATGFSTPVTFTCTGAPSEATCTVSPTSSTTSTTLTFTTTAPSAQLQLPFGRGTRIFYAALLPGLLGIMFTVGSRRRSLRGLRLLGMICVLSCSALWLGSCTGSNSGTKNAGTPPGTYPLTVSATTTTATGSGTPITNSNAFTLSLTVTP